MASIGYIAWKELRGYFTSWMAYVICAGWALLAGLTFASLLLASFLTGTFEITHVYTNLVIVLLFLSPLVTMRLIAEERSSGTLELLFTSPLTEWQVALGKWLGAIGFNLVLLVLTVHFPIFAIRFGNIDYGPVWGAYATLLCLSASFCAFGLFCSSLTDSQVVAGFLTFGGLLTSWMIAWPAQAAPDNDVAGFLAQFSIFSHFDTMLGGAIDSKDLIFFASICGFFLYATTRVLESRKWR